MAAKSYPCSPEQAMNFKRDVQTYCGVINSLVIGTATLTADLQGVVNPLNVSDTAGMTVTGIMSDYHYEGGQTQPLNFGFMISNTNQVTLTGLLDLGLSNTDIVIGYTIYFFDPAAKTYYTCNWTNGATLTGVIAKHGSELAIHCDVTPYHGIDQPLLFPVHLSVVPTPGSTQAIYLQQSNSAKNVTTWGVANPGSA